MRRRVLLFGLGGAAALAAMAAATAIRLRLGRRDAPEPTSEEAATPDAVDPGPDLAVTWLSEAALAERGIARRSLGDLAVRDGRIVAADPAVNPERPAFARPVPPGAYPVVLYVAQGRVALVELRLAEGAVAVWAMATVPGQDAGTLKPGRIFGYPVDAGLGCFMDTAGQAAFARREAQERARRGDRYNSFDGLIAGPLRAAGDREVLLRPMPDDPANVAIFQSGWGDGFYASYWGLDGAGGTLRLVTDFGVIVDGDGRTPQQRWTEGQIATMTPGQRRDSAAGYALLLADDLPGLEAMLKERRITPQTAIEQTHAPFTYMAVALDKPAALDLLVRYGAGRTVPPELGTRWATYADFARSYARTKPDGSPEYEWLKPRSPALMATIDRWDAAPKSR